MGDGSGSRKPAARFPRIVLCVLLSLALVVPSAFPASLFFVAEAPADLSAYAAGDGAPVLPAYFIGSFFDSGNTSKDGSKAMRLNGHATLGAGAFAGDIVIVPDAMNQNGNAFLSRPIYSETGFSAMFEIYMGSSENYKPGDVWRVADGWSFIVSKSDTAVGTYGNGLGYVGIPNSFALGFLTSYRVGNPTTAYDAVPLLRFGKDGSFTSDYSIFLPGSTGAEFTQDDVKALEDNKGADISNDFYLSNAKNYSIYAWVDYNVQEDYINIYLNIKPVKPNAPVISKGTPGIGDSDYTGIPQSVGNSYYIGFASGTGTGTQQIDLRQFYVLNNFAPDSLEFNDAGTGVEMDEDVTLVEDFTAPTAPVIQQSDDAISVGDSTDNVKVAKYQYRVSYSTSRTDWSPWTDYVYGAGANTGQPDLTGTTLVPLTTPDANTLVQARAIDTGGNISTVSDFNYTKVPTPSLTSPANGAANVRFENAQNLQISFSQAIDVTQAQPGSVAITKTSGGVNGVTPSLTGGAIAKNDSRWNATHSRLILPLTNMEYGATYQVTVSGFTSASGFSQDGAKTFSFSTIPRQDTPMPVTIDYAADALTLPVANTAYLVNGILRTSSNDANKRIPLTGGSGTSAYDLHGTTVSVVTPGDGVTIADSAPALVQVPAVPAAPTGMAGFNNRMYGVTADMQYANVNTPSTWTDVSGIQTDSTNGPYITPTATGLYYVRYKAVNTGDESARKFASKTTMVVVEPSAVTLNFTPPVFGPKNDGRIEQGSDPVDAILPLTAAGNIPASFKNSDIKLTGTDFELVKPAGGENQTTTIETSSETTRSQFFGIKIRPKANLPVGEHTATVSLEYKPQGKPKRTTTVDVHLTVTEKRPAPVIGYAEPPHIEGLVAGASYLINDVSYRASMSGSQGVIAWQDGWFGQTLTIIKANENTGLSSDPVTLPVKARQPAPAAVATAETFTGFSDGIISGVNAATMDYSSDSGSTWQTNIASLGNYDAQNQRITGLAPGSNYRLRFKATGSEFQSTAQTVTIAASQAAASWGVSLDTVQNGTFAFSPLKWGYTADAAANAAHTVTITNAGNQPTGNLTVALSGTNKDNFTLSKTSVDSIARDGTDSSVTVKPAAGLAKGTYTATLTVSGQESGHGRSAAFSRSYTLRFEVQKANITGFQTLSPWLAGVAMSLPEDRDTAAEVAGILLNGASGDDPPFAGYRKVTATLDSGSTVELDVTGWTNTGTAFSSEDEGGYIFTGTLGTLPDYIENTGTRAPTVTVIVNELLYGIRLSREDEYEFPAAEYGYGVSGMAAEARVTSIGKLATGEMTAALTGTNPEAFELSYGGASGQTVTIESVDGQSTQSNPFTVRPIAGLTPGTYTATVRVTGQNDIEDSFDVRFVVSANKVTGFQPITGVAGGNAGYAKDGFAAETVEATLLANYPSVTATCTNGTVTYPVTAWTKPSNYNTDADGSYVFTATLGAAPDYHELTTGAGVPTLTVVIDVTVDAATPVIGQHPSGGTVYTAVADPQGGLTLTVAASAPDASTGGTLSYQWYSNSASSTDGAALIDDATQASYAPPRSAPVGTTYYYCVVKNTNESVNGLKFATVNSNIVSVTVVKRAQTGPVTIDSVGTRIKNDGSFQLTTDGGGNGTGAIVFARTYGNDSVATVSEDGYVTVKTAGQITVKAKRLGDGDWLDGADSNEVNIDIGQNPVIAKAPTGLTAVYGKKLSEVSFGSTSAAPDSSITGVWSWQESGDTLVGAVGPRAHLATFTPTNDIDYKTVVNVSVSILVTEKELTVDTAELSFADKNYDGTTEVTVSGAAKLVGKVGTDDVGLVPAGVKFAFADAIADNTNKKTVNGTGSYDLSGSARSNYTLTQPTLSFAEAAYIKEGFIPAQNTHYEATTLNGGTPPDTAGWTNGNFVVTAMSGYAVSLTNTDAGDPWTSSLTFSSTTANSAASFYVRRTGAATGAINQKEISQQKVLTYSIDSAAPTATVKYKDNTFREFLNTITFGLFFKNTVDIEIKAADTGGSGIDKIYWYLDENPGASALDEAALAGKWDSLTGMTKTINVAANKKFALYAMVTDVAGNESQIYSDGIVVYKDGQIDTQGVSVTRFASDDRSVYVTTNSNSIAGIKRTTGPGVDDESAAPAILVPDTHYSVSGNLITLKGAYLSHLKATGEPLHTFTVSYNPLGETYKTDDRGDDGADLNDPPGTTSFTVTVGKAAQSAPIVSGTGLSNGAVSVAREAGSYELTATGGQSTGNFVWGSSETSVATVAGSDTNLTTGTATFTGDGSANATANISVYRAGDDDYLDSAATTIALTVKKDATPPTVGGSGVITASSVTQTTAPLIWTAATDNLTTAATDFTYFVYQSTQNNIADLNSCLTNGTLLNGSGTTSADTNITYTATGLSEGKAYWFNIIVKDKAGNQAAYSSVQIVTRTQVTFSAVQQGGKNGRVNTTHILVTFDRDIQSFDSGDVTVSDGAMINGAITNAGDALATTWLVPITLDAGTANGAQVTVTIAGFTNGMYGYDLEQANQAKQVTVYAPYPWELPTAQIDYVNERLTNLANGGIYKFANNNNDYNGDVAASETGTYGIPYGGFGVNVFIKRVAYDPAGADELGRTESQPQTLPIPARPDAPTLTFEQPQAVGDKGAVMVTNAVSGKTYEYITAADYATIQSGDNYKTSLWKAAGTASGATHNVPNIDPGSYYIRVKAVEGTSFASSVTAFQIHNSDEIIFEALQGYAFSDVPAQKVSDNITGTVTSVEWNSDSSNGNGYFTFINDGTDGYIVQPVTGLGQPTPGTYTANLDVIYDTNNTTTLHLSFTVYPKAEFTTQAGDGLAGAVASSTYNEKGGITDTLTLNFKYATDIAYGDVVLGGANKTAGKTNFRQISEDNKTYVLDVTLPPGSKTGDDINVTVKLGDNSKYVYQVSKIGADTNIRETAKVTIPRSISAARTIPIAPGLTPDFSSGIVEFTLAESKSPIPPSALEYAGGGTYSGPVVLSGTAGATITGIYRVGDSGFTYRMTLNVNTAGAATIAIPSWDVNASDAFTITDGLTKGSRELGALGAALDASGAKYPDGGASGDAYQVLDNVTANATQPYVAPALALRANLEYSAGVTAEVRVYSGTNYATGQTLTTSEYTLTGGGAVTAAGLTDQLVVTLNEDWTRVDGDYRIVVVLNDNDNDDTDGFPANTVIRGAFTVSGITATKLLTVINGTGGASATASSPYGVAPSVSLTSGYYEPGKDVTLTATPDTGYKFSHWTQTPDNTIATLPSGATGTITMPNADVTLTANYTDGVAPVTTPNLAANEWTKDKVILTATDADVTKGGGDNPTGAGLGTVASISYKIDIADAFTTGALNQGSTDVSLASYADGAHTITYYAVDADGNAETQNTLTVNKDSTAPTGSIAVNGETYPGFITPTAVTKFRKTAVSGTIAGADTGGSGVDAAKTECLVTTEKFESAEAALGNSSADWTTGENFAVAADVANGRYYVYARITDKVGNVGVAGAADFLKYTDSEATVTAPAFTKTSGADVDVTIAMNGNTVKSVEKKVGTVYTPLTVGTNADYTTAANKVTLKASYLQTLTADTHTFVVSYYPGGVTDNPVGSGNDTPGTTTISLTVNKSGSAKVSLAVNPAKGANPGAVYGTDNVKLTATVEGTTNFDPTGFVAFYAEKNGSKAPLGSKDISDGTAELPVTLEAYDDYTLTAVYSGDGNYASADSAAIEDYSVAKANQQPPTVTGVVVGEGGQLTLAATYGVGSVDLTASGSVAGAGYEWNSDKTNVATVSDVGRIQILSFGTATISVKSKGNDNYNESAKTEISLTVSARTPIVVAPANLSATYGDTLASVDLSGVMTSGGTPSVNGAWTWDDADPNVTLVGAVGNATHTATFTPTDSTNNNAVPNVQVILTVGPKPLTATATATNRAYDGTTDVAVAVTLDGFLTSDDVTATATGTIDSADASDTPYPVTVEDITLSGENADSYTAPSGVTNSPTVVISTKEVTVTAKDKTINYKDPLPTPTEADVEYAGFVSPDTADTALDIKALPRLTQTDNTQVGQTDIVFTSPGHEAALNTGIGANYRLTHEKGTLTINAVAPYAPISFKATAGSGSVTLSWTAGDNGGSAVTKWQYQMKAGADAYGNWTEIPNSDEATAAYTVTGLTNGTAYTFVLRAVNAAGGGIASGEAAATPQSNGGGSGGGGSGGGGSDDLYKDATEAVKQGTETILPVIITASENYETDAIEAFEQALDELQSALSGGASAIAQALDAYKVALDGLVHTHPVVEQNYSEKYPVDDFGLEVTVKIKGYFGSVTEVLFDGKSLTLGPASSDGTSRPLALGATKAGTLKAGSVIVDLDSGFVDTLANGEYEIAVRFADDFGATLNEGSGEAIIVVDRQTDGEGWQKQADGAWKYIVDGVAATGWQKIKNKWYYLDGANGGTMEWGWQKIKNKWYYLGGADDGVMKWGWKKINAKWYYLGSADDGAMKWGWKKINAKWYYLGGADDGAMKWGWKKINAKWYYFGGADDGAMKCGWKKINAKWYYLGGADDGAMKSGWKKINAKWYYLGGADDGAMKSGWRKVKAKWYYLGGADDGSMKWSWHSIGGKLYYLGGADDGAMRTGWQTIAGSRYYFGGADDGALRWGWKRIDGKWYYFDPNSGALKAGPRAAL